MLDALASEYGWTHDFLMEELPLCQAIAYYRTIQRRYGVHEGAPSFEEEDILDAQGDELRRQLRAAAKTGKRVLKRMRERRARKASR